MQENGPYDDLVGRLAALRVDVGSPSFGDIATSVSRVRRERGLTPERARVGRTTVYDAFRMGRQRIDADLVGDIVRALGADESLAQDWADEARRARRAAPAVTVPSVPSGPTGPTGPTEPTEPTPVAPTPASPSPSPSPAAVAPRPLPGRWVLVVLVCCLAANLVGRVTVDVLSLPIYLDMVGTALTAILLGPWWGALLGGLTNVLGVSVSGTDSLLFTPVNVAGGLLWGFGARYGMTRSIPRFFGLNVLVAVACSCIAVPTIVTIDHGFGGHGSDQITLSAQALLMSVWASVTVSNLLTSVVDKLICGFVSLAVLESLAPDLRPVGWMSAASRAVAPPEDRDALTRH